MDCKVKKVLQGSLGLFMGITLMSVGAKADIEDDYPQMSKAINVVVDNQTDDVITVNVTTSSKEGRQGKKLLSYSPRGVSAYALVTEENISTAKIEGFRMGMTKCTAEGQMSLPYSTEVYNLYDEEDGMGEISFVVTQKTTPALGRNKKESKSCQVSLRRHS